MKNQLIRKQNDTGAFPWYVQSGTDWLRCGFTTGTCAALAASGAAQYLLTGRLPDQLYVRTPMGIPVEVKPEYGEKWEDGARCSVRKDAGDDPDCTDAILVTASVAKTESGICIRGGEGVGRVTKPGLDQPVGEAAINHVPREMIRAAAEDVCAACGYTGGLMIEISIPGGRELARKTFNPQLGIVDGISVLGTSGIVEPMSEQALLDTIALAVRQAGQIQKQRLILVPGNYGLDHLRSMQVRIKDVPQVVCSNFIGDSICFAMAEGFQELILVGHIGKLIKLAGGIMNTHSKMADCRMELFCAHAALCGADTAVCRNLMEQVSTDGCLEILDHAGMRDDVMHSLLTAIQKHLDRCAAGRIRIGAVLFANVYGTLGMTQTAELLLKEWNSIA